MSGIHHAFPYAHPQSSDPTLVSKSQWDDDHVIPDGTITAPMLAAGVGDHGLTDVLTVSNDGGGLGITQVPSIIMDEALPNGGSGQVFVQAKAADAVSSASLTLTSNGDGGTNFAIVAANEFVSEQLLADPSTGFAIHTSALAVAIATDFGSAGQALVSNGASKTVWGSILDLLIAGGVQALFVEPTTATPEQIANRLIACGLMAPS
jgi:hypothetical protein